MATVEPEPKWLRDLRVRASEGCMTCIEALAEVLVHGGKTEPFMPPHEASKNCESGKRSHCSCDTCF